MNEDQLNAKIIGLQSEVAKLKNFIVERHGVVGGLMMDAARLIVEADAAARAAPGVPAGWKLVPIAATEAMTDEARWHCVDSPHSMWHDMLAAAPAGINQLAGGAVPANMTIERAASAVESYGNSELAADLRALAVPVQADRGEATGAAIELWNETGARLQEADDTLRAISSYVGQGGCWDTENLNYAEMTARIKEGIDVLVRVAAAPVAPLPLPEGPSIEQQNLQGMADCMDMVRSELIEMGIIDKSIAPIFIANAVGSYIRALAAAPVAPPASPSEMQIPEGFALVPVAPTTEQADRGAHVNSEWLNDNAPIGERRYRDPAISVYKAMVQIGALPGSTPDAAQGGA